MNIAFDFILEKMGMNRFLILQSVRQKSIYHEAFEEDLRELEETGYIEKMKNGSYKATSKGCAFLEQATEVNVDQDTIVLADRLISEYESKGKSAGKRREIESRLAWFISASYFSDNAIIDGVSSYLAENPQYTMSLENLLWKQPSVFSAHKSLKDSRLFSEIMKKNDNISDRIYFDNKFVNSKIKWLIAVSKLPVPPTGMDDKDYLTGDRNEDRMAITRIKRILYENIKKR